MGEIKLGICIPGEQIEEKLPWAIASGFESVSIAFKAPRLPMDLKPLARTVCEVLKGTGVTVASLGCLYLATRFLAIDRPLKKVM